MGKVANLYKRFMRPSTTKIKLFNEDTNEFIYKGTANKIPEQYNDLNVLSFETDDFDSKYLIVNCSHYLKNLLMFVEKDPSIKVDPSIEVIERF